MGGAANNNNSNKQKLSNQDDDEEEVHPLTLDADTKFSSPRSSMHRILSL